MIIIAVLFVLFCLVPLCFSCFCWLQSKYPLKEVTEEKRPLIEGEEPEEKNGSKFKEEMNNWVNRHTEPPKSQWDLQEGEVLVERRPRGEGKSDPQMTTNHPEEQVGRGGKPLKGILLEDHGMGKPDSFAMIFKRMAFKPTFLEVMKAEERDPSKSLIQNWFEYCQPQFEIPSELTVWSSNESDCVDHDVQAWDLTAYLVEDQYFINASIVPMPGMMGNLGQAIICQAPMDSSFERKTNTCGRFWKMVHELKAEFIVMACQFVENEQPTCGKYFPEHKGGTKTYGSITVTLTDQHDMYGGDLIVRKISYHLKSNKADGKTLTHFQFTKWKARTIPTGEVAIEALKFVNQQVRRRLIPYICHSNLGTGRACVFTGIEYLTSMICNRSSRVSTHCFQVDFRSKRLGAIETGEQLYFVQNMAFELLIKDFGYTTEYSEKMKIEWDNLRNYYDKGPRNRKMLLELQAYELEKFGELIPFSSTGKKATILTVSAPPVPKQSSLRDKGVLDQLKNEMKAAEKSHNKSAMKPALMTAVDKTRDASIDKTQTVSQSFRPPRLGGANLDQMDFGGAAM
uniref:Tyrosine-protein phosphatase domain-containing protein n=1 Tax=Caenorhabditis tropicalis TaxID=1561998 RepID=A0A1I7UMA7_9PELO